MSDTKLELVLAGEVKVVETDAEGKVVSESVLENKIVLEVLRAAVERAIRQAIEDDFADSERVNDDGDC